jgi:hypothetical protein
MKVLTSQKGPCYTSYVQMEVKEVYCKVHETAYLLVGTMMKAGGLNNLPKGKAKLIGI